MYFCAAPSRTKPPVEATVPAPPRRERQQGGRTVAIAPRDGPGNAGPGRTEQPDGHGRQRKRHAEDAGQYDLPLHQVRDILAGSRSNAGKAGKGVIRGVPFDDGLLSAKAGTSSRAARAFSIEPATAGQAVDQKIRRCVRVLFE